MKFLNNDFIIKFSIDSNNTVENIAHTQSSSNILLEISVPEEEKKANKKGRPSLSFNEGSKKIKKRRIENLLSKYRAEEVLRAAECLQNQSHNDSDTEEEDIRNIENDHNVLAMYMNLELTKVKYNKLRTYNERLRGSKLYPPYIVIKNAKDKCYPTDVNVNDFGASVNVEQLLIHTTSRILLTLHKEKLYELRDEELLLHGKWGMDGASGQQTTRQRWLAETEDQSTNTDDEIVKNTFTDNAVFIISFVPLQLVAHKNIIWKNERPSSTIYCRPIKFQFIKESNSMIMNEYTFYWDTFNKLRSSYVTVENIIFNVTFNIQCTMIDGKICNILSGQKSSNCCNICGVGPKDVNNIKFVKSLPCKEDNYKFGLSILHCWIRFMEYLLHICYNFDFKKGCAKGEDKILKAKRKRRIQKLLKSKLSLTVDVVKQGSGTTNTGNVIRSFFAQAESVAEITGLDKDVIKRLDTILQTVACGRNINCEKFDKYCLDTAELCLNLYSWYSMPPSVHKVLVHGCNIIKHVGLPIGCLSEEAQEANNKIFRKARAHCNRMKSRKCTNEDIMHYLLIASDPVISNIRIKEEKASTELTPDIRALLVESHND